METPTFSPAAREKIMEAMKKKKRQERPKKNERQERPNKFILTLSKTKISKKKIILSRTKISKKITAPAIRVTAPGPAAVKVPAQAQPGKQSKRPTEYAQAYNIDAATNPYGTPPTLTREDKMKTSGMAKNRVTETQMPEPSLHPQVPRPRQVTAKRNGLKRKVLMPTGTTTWRYSRCFTPECREGVWYHVLVAKQAWPKRKQSCRQMSSLLRLSRFLTREEWNQSEYQDMKSMDIHFREHPKLGSVPGSMKISTADIQKNFPELWPKLVRLNEIITDPEYEVWLRKHQSPDKKNVRTYNCAMSLQPGDGDSRTQLGGIARAAYNDKYDMHLEAVKLASELTTTVLEDFYIRSGFKPEIYRRWLADAPICFGTKDNIYTTSLQLNLAVPEVGGLRDIGAKGKTHIDKRDDPFRHSMVWFMGNMNLATTFPGRFNQTALKLSCFAEPLSGLVFSAKDAHRGTGTGLYDASIPADSVLRFRPDVEYPVLKAGTPKVRATFVAYPSMSLTRPMYKPNSEIYRPIGLAHFGDLQNQHEWRLRDHMRLLRKNGTAESEMPSAETLVSMFSWKNPLTKQTEFPRKTVAADSLSVNRGNDSEWEKIMKVVNSTKCGIASIPLTPEERVATKLRRTAKDERRAENRRLLGAGLKKLPNAKHVKKIAGAGKEGVIKRKDPTIWTDVDFDTKYRPEMEGALAEEEWEEEQA